MCVCARVCVRVGVCVRLSTSSSCSVSFSEISSRKGLLKRLANSGWHPQKHGHQRCLGGNLQNLCVSCTHSAYLLAPGTVGLPNFRGCFLQAYAHFCEVHSWRDCFRTQVLTSAASASASPDLTCSRLAAPVVTGTGE